MADLFAQAASRPNVIFFLTDDWPYELWPTNTVGSRGAPNNYGSLLPNIAMSFVAEGLELDHVYAHKISVPSRRAFFAGRYVTSLGVPYTAYLGLSAKISTLGDRMKAAGYTTAMLGKWYLGFSSPSLLPAARGFDTSIGFFEHSIDQYEWHARSRNSFLTTRGEVIYDLFINNTRVTRDHPIIAAGRGKVQYDPATYAGGRLAMHEAGDPNGLLAAQALDEEGRYYSQDVLDDEMVRVINGAKEPFFIVMSTPGLHEPLDSRAHQRTRTFTARSQHLAAAAGCPWHESWTTRVNPTQCDATARNIRFEREAMAMGVDDSVGIAVSRLKVRGIWDRTLMVFMSDNGGLNSRGAPNTPLRGGKNTLLEGGLHVRTALGGGYVPAVLRGRSSRTVMHEVDWYVTLSYLAGVPPYEDPLADLHGIDLPVDGRNAAPSWRMLYTTSFSSSPINELVSSGIADWCGTGTTRSPGVIGEGCSPGTRLIVHDLEEWYTGSGGHTFSLITQSKAYKVYAFNERACPGLPWEGCAPVVANPETTFFASVLGALLTS